MTVCNMSIEAGARAGMIAPDETTYDYLAGRAARPAGRGLGARPSRAGARCPRDPGARFDREVDIDAAAIEPMITYGTNPGMVVPIGGAIPTRTGDAVFDKALAYMGFERRRADHGPVRSTSCSSAAAPTAACRTCAAPPRCCAAARSRTACTMLVVPGSQQVKRDAEAEGLDRDLHGRRRRVARVRLLDVPRHERRHRSRAGSTRSAPATAISKAARARARARCWRAR